MADISPLVIDSVNTTVLHVYDTRYRIFDDTIIYWRSTSLIQVYTFLQAALMLSSLNYMTLNYFWPQIKPWSTCPSVRLSMWVHGWAYLREGSIGYTWPGGGVVQGSLSAHTLSAHLHLGFLPSFLGVHLNKVLILNETLRLLCPLLCNHEFWTKCYRIQRKT